MKKEEMVAARLPETLVSDIKKIEAVEQTDRSSVLRKLLDKAVTDWKKEYAAKRYAEGSITLERAATDADVSVREMMEYFKQKKTVSQYDREDLEEDMKNFYKRIPKKTTILTLNLSIKASFIACRAVIYGFNFHPQLFSYPLTIWAS